MYIRGGSRRLAIASAAFLSEQSYYTKSKAKFGENEVKAVAGFELRVAGCEFRVAGCELRVVVSSCELRVEGCGLRVEGCGLRVVVWLQRSGGAGVLPISPVSPALCG